MVTPPPAAVAPSLQIWQCPICLDTLSEPMLTTCCGQSFCCECLDAALRRVDACPMCRAPLLTGEHVMTRNRALDELLKRMATTPEDGDDVDERDVLRSIHNEAKTTTVSRLHRIRDGLERLRSAYTSLRLQQWHHWLRVHWATLQCVFYVFLFGVFVLFLRVQEEEFADQAIVHRPRLRTNTP